MANERRGWWETGISTLDSEKYLLIKGYGIADLIGRVSYGEMFYLLMKGELPGQRIGQLMEAMLVAACDHIITPASAAVRMASTCGVTFNSSLATGLNLLGDIHGGAGELAMEVFYQIKNKADSAGRGVEELVEEKCQELSKAGEYMPGYDLRSNEQRARRLFQLANAVRKEGDIQGAYLDIASAFEPVLAKTTGKKLFLNVDGAQGAILCELNMPKEVAKGMFCLSRGLGLVAHIYEEMQNGQRIKGPMPRDMLFKECPYTGPGKRELPPDRKALP